MCLKYTFAVGMLPNSTSENKFLFDIKILSRSEASAGESIPPSDEAGRRGIKINMTPPVVFGQDVFLKMSQHASCSYNV